MSVMSAALLEHGVAEDADLVGGHDAVRLPTLPAVAWQAGDAVRVETPSSGSGGDHYFTASPRPLGPPHGALVLPDLTLTLATDRGVFSADGIDPGTKLLLLRPHRRPPTGELLDLGCGYGPIALTLAAVAGRDGVGGRRERAGPGAVRRQRAAHGTPQRPRRRARTTCPTTCASPRSGRTRRSASASRAPRTAARWLARLDAGAQASWSCTATSAPTPSAAGWKQGWRSRLASRQGYRLLDVAAGPGAPMRQLTGPA